MKTSINASLVSRQNGLGKIAYIIRFDVLAELTAGITFPCQKGCKAKIGKDGRIMEVCVGQHSFEGRDGKTVWTDNVALTPPEQFGLYQVFAEAWAKNGANINDLPEFVAKERTATATPEAAVAVTSAADALKAKYGPKAA
jgi:hypothetical protein